VNTTVLTSAPPLAELATSWATALDAEGKSPATITAYLQGAQLRHLVPVAFLASIRLDVAYLRRHVLLMLFVPFASLAAVRLNGFLGRHWRQPMQLHPFHSKEKPAVTK
jgi:hypothetical protein